MGPTSIGDGSRHFAALRQTAQARARLDQLSQELASGRVADPAAHLGPDATRLTATVSGHSAAEAYSAATTETGQILSLMQSALGSVDAARETLAGQVVLVGPSTSDAALYRVGASAWSGFETIISALNTRLGDRALFAGTASDGAALAPASDMLAAIVATLPPTPGAVDVETALDTWFYDPAGGFATSGYLGDTGAAATRRLDVGQELTISARADDASLRDVLKAAAMAALAGDPDLGLGTVSRRDLMRRAGNGLLAAASPLIESRGALGAAEATVDQISARHAARATALAMMRNDMTEADPYETVTALQQVQLQLETQYTLTARLQGLSLVEYLR